MLVTQKNIISSILQYVRANKNTIIDIINNIAHNNQIIFSILSFFII